MGRELTDGERADIRANASGEEERDRIGPADRGARAINDDVPLVVYCDLALGSTERRDEARAYLARLLEERRS